MDRDQLLRDLSRKLKAISSTRLVDQSLTATVHDSPGRALDERGTAEREGFRPALTM
jgi:hypothetical protein